MASMNVSLPKAMKDWIESRVRSGSYANTSDYLRDLVRHDQMEQEKLEVLRAAVDSGRASGVSTRSLDDLKAEALRRARAASHEG